MAYIFELTLVSIRTCVAVALQSCPFITKIAAAFTMSEVTTFVEKGVEPDVPNGFTAVSDLYTYRSSGLLRVERS